MDEDLRKTSKEIGNLQFSIGFRNATRGHSTSLSRLSRASNFPLAPLARLELPSRAPRTSLSRASNFPLARLATSLSRASRLEWDFQIAAKSEWAHGGRGSLTPLGPAPLARRPRRVPLAGARRPPRLPLGGACARHFLWGTFL